MRNIAFGFTLVFCFFLGESHGLTSGGPLETGNQNVGLGRGELEKVDPPTPPRLDELVVLDSPHGMPGDGNLVFSEKGFSGGNDITVHAKCGNNEDLLFGVSCSDVGDVDGDFIADFAVGIPFGDINPGADAIHDVGFVNIFSGSNGDFIVGYTFNLEGQQFGWSIAGVGDVNGDGYGDIIVGAPGDDLVKENAGTAFVISTKDNLLLEDFVGLKKGSFAGTSVANAGDFKKDGFTDYIVGEPGFGKKDFGRAKVYSGKNGNKIKTIKGNKKFDMAGTSVAGAGDVNGDGHDDVIVGFPNGVEFPGKAKIISGKSKKTLYILETNNPVGIDTWFGYSVSGAGDVNGDGFDDVVVGEPMGVKISNNVKSGRALVFSGEDGSVLMGLGSSGIGDLAGWSVSSVDINDDGRGDVVLGVPGYDPSGFVNGGRFRAFGLNFGSPQLLMNIALSQPGAQFGYAVSGYKDIDGDGLREVISSAPYLDTINHDDAGCVYVIKGDS